MSDMAQQTPAPRSWAPEVIADSSGRWCGNALRFATQGEAEAYALDLSLRWVLVRDTRAVPSADPVAHRWDPSVGVVPVPKGTP